MSTSDLPCISGDLEQLLLNSGNYRLTTNELVGLKIHLKMISGWANKMPSRTHFFFIKWEPVLVLPRVEGFTKSELAIAVYLQPLHSQLCAIAVQVLWKADQLIRALCAALNTGDLIVGATMARSLIETSASFGCETHAIMSLWKDRKSEPVPDLASLADFHHKTSDAIGQILFGTKLKREKEPETGVERTNILTLVDKAGKLSGESGLRRIYDVLCDTVHPSIGSNLCFWTKQPTSEDGPVYEFIADRYANSGLGDLPFFIAKGTLWALIWLGHMWVMFERTRNDICLTAKIYALPQTYYGMIRPGDPSGYCSCGSGKREEACNHTFGNGQDCPISETTC